VYEGYGATGCTIGDKTFSGFDFLFAPASLETGPPPFAITVTPFLDNPNTPSIPTTSGFQLTFGLLQSVPGTQDITVIL